MNAAGGSNWPMVALGDLMLRKAPSINPLKHPNDSFALYSIPAFDAGSPEMVTGKEIGSSKKIAQPKDVMLSRIVPHIRRACVVKKHDVDHIAVSGEWISFRHPCIYPDYLKHTLVGDPFHSQFMQTVAGVGGSLLRARPEAVARIQIPLPPLDEQKRIAAILDKADALRRKRRDALALLDTLTQSIFVEMFGEYFSDAHLSETTPLKSVAEVGSGITKGRKLKGSSTRTVPYLAVSNVQDKYLNLTRVKTIEASDAEIERYKLRQQDLLLTEGGDPDKLGRGTLWNGELDEAIHQNHIFRVRITNPSVRPIFLKWMVGSTFGKSYFLKVAKQTTGIASINKTQLSNFPVIIPDLREQTKFEGSILDVESLIEHSKSSLNNLDALFTSLQSRAFSGQL